MPHPATGPSYVRIPPQLSPYPKKNPMTPDAVLIQEPRIDFTTFLGLSHKMLGYSPAAAADASRRELTDAERFLSCLAALKDPDALEDKRTR